MGLKWDPERDWGLEVGSCIEPYGLFTYLNSEMEKLLPSKKYNNSEMENSFSLYAFVS